MVSVVMTVYNGQLHLSKSIESVLRQTYQNFEFIIVNDGSTDLTKKIISDYAKTDKRIKLIDISHRGIPYSANIGISKAKGKYIARIDHDDIWFLNKLEYQLNILSQNPNVKLLGSSIIPINGHGDRIKNFQSIFNGNDKYNSTEFRLGILKKCLICHSSSMFSKNAFYELGQYNESLSTSEDYELWIRFASRYNCTIDNTPLAYYRIWGGNITERKKISMLINSFKVRLLGLKILGINYKNLYFLIQFLFNVVFRSFIYWLFVKQISLILRKTTKHQ